MELYSLTLPNGIRLVHCPVNSPVAHCGIFIRAGTRDETDKEHGIAHFIEHTIFKGTQKRSVSQVLNRLENVGADLNAFTTKEETCIHASFLNSYYDRTLELFQDIFFHSVFPEKELMREKQVVMEEIRSYRDTPDEQIFDDFEDLMFTGHPLGKSILGTPASLKKIKQEHIFDFIHRNYRLSEVVISSVGSMEVKKLARMVEKHFSHHPSRGDSHPRIPFRKKAPFAKTIKKRTLQVHCMTGAPAYDFGDERRIPLALLNNMLGGPVMNSRLSLALRERNGLTYHTESNYTAYSDAGIIQIYFGTDPGKYEKALEITREELKRLREQKLGTTQLHLVKKQITGQLALAQESNLATMLAIGKSYLLQNRFTPVEEIIARIQAVTAGELLEIANEIFDEKQLSMLTFR